ncbi:MAG: Plug domain-containing protein, partial [Cyanobacteria bacterium P01_H01_bin.105]
MRQLYLLKSLWLSGLLWIFLCQVVIAELATELDSELPAVDALNNQEEAVPEWISQTPTSDTDELEEEEEEEEEEKDTLRIVVTAEKTPEVVQDVPISLTVLTEDELEDADITSLDGIAGNTPNFSSFSATGSRSFAFYSIRGLSNQNFGSRDPVAFYIDDVPYDYGSFIDLDLPDLQQVEILRGPQNTLYGRSSQAG